MNRRGQGFLVEMLAALIIFSAIFAVWSSRYEETRRDVQHAFLKSSERSRLDHVVDDWLRFSGEPSEWEALASPTGLTYFGLVDANRTLDPEKIQKFVEWLNDPAAYAVLREKMGMGTYDVYVRIKQPVNQFGVRGANDVNGIMNTCANGISVVCSDQQANGLAISLVSLSPPPGTPACGGFVVEDQPCSFLAYPNNQTRDISVVRRVVTTLSPFTNRQEVRILEFVFSTPI